MKIATWNVNSIRARLERVVTWLERHRPDVLCMQETKVEDALFPKEALEDLGYNVLAFGQRSYNGVAILSRHAVEDVVRGLPGEDPEDHKRVLGCTIQDVMLLDVYVPNGQAVGHPRFFVKLAWLERLRELLAQRYPMTEKVIVTGDFNVTFDDRDVHDPVKWHERILCSTPERQALRQLMACGLADGLRRFHQEGGIYTWWFQRGAALQRGEGLRIDHFLLSPGAYEACTSVTVDIEERAGRGSSDHAPVIATFGDG